MTTNTETTSAHNLNVSQSLAPDVTMSIKTKHLPEPSDAHDPRPSSAYAFCFAGAGYDHGLDHQRERYPFLPCARLRSSQLDDDSMPISITDPARFDTGQSYLWIGMAIHPRVSESIMNSGRERCSDDGWIRDISHRRIEKKRHREFPVIATMRGPKDALFMYALTEEQGVPTFTQRIGLEGKPIRPEGVFFFTKYRDEGDWIKDPAQRRKTWYAKIREEIYATTGTRHCTTFRDMDAEDERGSDEDMEDSDEDEDDSEADSKNSEDDDTNSYDTSNKDLGNVESGAAHDELMYLVRPEPATISHDANDEQSNVMVLDSIHPVTSTRSQDDHVMGDPRPAAESNTVHSAPASVPICQSQSKASDRWTPATTHSAATLPSTTLAEHQRAYPDHRLEVSHSAATRPASVGTCVVSTESAREDQRDIEVHGTTSTNVSISLRDCVGALRILIWTAKRSSGQDPTLPFAGSACLAKFEDIVNNMDVLRKIKTADALPALVRSFAGVLSVELEMAELRKGAQGGYLSANDAFVFRIREVMEGLEVVTG
ncbi:hypothetical protein CAC42_5801 [Sphaceloma murrayae]|uniref:Uncharacterized protein n=1 Tax=Sphaceloma murrayae TaxID=2082308 RepID=A0A2K1QZ81_9PEZI|nr:hypothetical protein CAC42_5801 [Sphaceloma murrayae]